MTADPHALQEQASRLKAAGRLDEALECNRRAVAAAPTSAVAEHNLASTLGDLSRFTEAERASARAMAKGLDAPETWLVRARALQGLGRIDEAENAFKAAIARRPGYLEAHRDLAQLRWMRSADARFALRHLDEALATPPLSPDLVMLKARVLVSTGHPEAAFTLLNRALGIMPGHAPLHQAIARIAAELGDAARQFHHATAAFRLSPSSGTAAKDVVEALLHAGQPKEAETLVLRILARAPDDQGLLALLATAWRLLGDERHKTLCEDVRLISFSSIAAPSGWPDLPAFLADLAGTLRSLHGWRSHPLEQSLRHGSQTQTDLSRSDLPAVKALFQALDAPIRRHIAGLGPGHDPLRRRTHGTGYRIIGAWSVLLQPQGFHIDHVHPEGWISSAFYVSLPATIAQDHQGWLAFGRPGIPTSPTLAPFRHIRPEPGHVALFPSYLWHGTEPFDGDEPRLTVAFDLAPA